MASSSFEIDTPLTYHVAQQNILQRLDAGDDAEDVREQWQQTVNRIIDNRLAGNDVLAFVAVPNPSPGH